ncbi:hypothetical protein P4O66_017524 [Electrophorus voltai]|uniref:Protein CUSTOS n=1 Tax=Electrophorus voltai TaxID=2609070 RepID=A0AAD8YWH5_9TELE|nr:hypothetical protein P4O66_017524 [Electrophorus voltai]
MSSTESSSEDENTERFKEAVWILGPRPNGAKRGPDTHAQVSKRVDVSEHEHDGNELQTTPEFRRHVARKLAVMLDSFVTEVSSGTPEPEPCENAHHGDDAGFRLFSTSLPGRWWKEQTPPLPPKRPPAPSSSDSDSEMELRLREAAVCVSDLLSFSTEKAQETGETEEGTKDSAGPVMKKRKRKTGPTEERQEEESLSKADGAIVHKQSTSQEQGSEEHVLKRRKKKSKIKRLDVGGQN